jgi:hypothetical protein
LIEEDKLLLDEIIEADDSIPLSSLLRKCLRLESEIENDNFKIWCERELDGYSDENEIPDYRKITVSIKGTFSSYNGHRIDNMPLSSHVLKSEHRRFGSCHFLTQPIASYNLSRFEENNILIVEWPGALVALYRNDFLTNYELLRAWQVIPTAALLGVTDKVRTKVLKLALELKKESRKFNFDVSKVPKDKVQNMVVYNIFGGNNVIANEASNFSQSLVKTVNKGDLSALMEAFKSIGFIEGELSEIKHLLENKNGGNVEPSVIKKWIGKIGSAVGNASLRLAVDEAKPHVTDLISQYLGYSL